MKYVIFAIALAGVPPLSVLLYLNERWRKHTFWGVMASLVFYGATSINFLSMESYRGTSRGMEVSLAHLVSLSLLLSLYLGRKVKSVFPETGFVLYAIYFLTCLPSLGAAADTMLSWFEIWKMLTLYVFYLTVYWYFKVSDDLKSCLYGLAILAIANMAMVMLNRFQGAYQSHGLFPHQNSMAMGMMQLGTLFLAAYLLYGIRERLGRLGFAACACAGLAIVRSYSRGATALMPLAFGLTALFCMRQGSGVRVRMRLLPMVLFGLVGAALLLPRIIERFEKAPEASGNTRVELAYCAMEMARDEPLRGVGLNNWSLKMQYPYEYQDRAIDRLGREFNYTAIVETVYLLTLAECGAPALLALLLWLGWHWVSCLRLMKRLRGTRWAFMPAGMLGGLTAIYTQSALEWVLRQQMNMFMLVMMFAMISYLNKSWRGLRELDGAPPLENM